MEEENQGTPGVEEIATPPAQAATPGETPVTTQEKSAEQYVPLSRFTEQNRELKEAREKLTALEAAQQRITRAFAPEDSGPTKFDDETIQSLRASGFMTREEVESERARERVEQDASSIQKELRLSDDEMAQARKHAKDMGVTSGAGLRAATRDLYLDKIMENKIKEVAAGGKPKATAEKPGPGGAALPAPEVKKGISIRERIHLAAEKAKQQ